MHNPQKGRKNNTRLKKGMGINMEVTGQEYRKMSDIASPRSPTLANCVKAFVIGGGICATAQLMTIALQNTGMMLKEARMLSTIVLIAASALLTALNLYDNVARHAGAGTLVPITGFANSIVSPAMEFKSEGLIAGLAVKMFSIAGPVLVYGITASIIYGLILNLMSVL